VKSLPLPWLDGLGRRPTDDEIDGIVAQLRDDGLLIIGTDALGNETWTLTAEGVQVARQLAMRNEATINAILDAVKGRR
jgi:hypothetical protein